MNESNKSRAILITGCSSGIGAAMALGLQQRGYRVFASARRFDDLASLAAQGLEVLRLDLTDSLSIKNAVREVLNATGGTLYGLFNNAGYGQPGAVEDLTREVLREVFETNLFGTHELTCAVLPVMRQQGYGRIVQNSSLLGYAALPYRGAYNASKFALEGLTDTLRLELAQTNIHIALLEPGPIISKFRQNAYAMFLKNINRQKSAHRETYDAMEWRFNRPGPVAPFTLPAEAVLPKLIHALEAKRPKSRYRITKPAYFFALTRRLLTTRMQDYIAQLVSRSERVR